MKQTFKWKISNTSKTITNFKLFEVGVPFGYYYGRISDHVEYGLGSIKLPFLEVSQRVTQECVFKFLVENSTIVTVFSSA